MRGKTDPPEPLRGLRSQAREKGIAGNAVLSGCQRVFAPDGREIAELRELIVDRSGRIHYGLIACTSRDGQGEKLVPVPWDAFEQCEGGRGRQLCLQLLSDVLTHVRGYDPRFWPALHTLT